MARRGGSVVPRTNPIGEWRTAVPIIDRSPSPAVPRREMENDLVFLLTMSIVLSVIKSHAAIVNIELVAPAEEPNLLRSENGIRHS